MSDTENIAASEEQNTDSSANTDVQTVEVTPQLLNDLRIKGDSEGLAKAMAAISKPVNPSSTPEGNEGVTPVYTGTPPEGEIVAPKTFDINFQGKDVKVDDSDNYVG